MNRDGRGRPGRIRIKNEPQLTLTRVLQRRRSSLSALVNELGLSTYASLVAWCRRMGLVPPDEQQFLSSLPSVEPVNDPQEGVIVLDALSPDETSAAETLSWEPSFVQEAHQKKRRPKKEDSNHTPEKMS